MNAEELKPQPRTKLATEEPGLPTQQTGSLDYARAVEEFYQPLYRFAFALTGRQHDAEDLTQETYHVLLTKGGQIRDLRKLKGWLFTTLYRRFLGRQRHAARFSEVPVESVENELPAVGPQTQARVDTQAVLTALERLDPKYKAPLVLFYLQELSYREIAAILHLPIGTVMSRLSRGKAILRAGLRSDPVTADVRWPEPDAPALSTRTSGDSSLFAWPVICPSAAALPA